MSDLAAVLARLDKHAAKSREIAENCDAVVVAFADQMKAFEARTGHNVYAVRMAVDHRNSAKSERQLADDLSVVISVAKATVELREMIRKLRNAKYAGSTDEHLAALVAFEEATEKLDAALSALAKRGME